MIWEEIQKNGQQKHLNGGDYNCTERGGSCSLSVKNYSAGFRNNLNETDAYDNISFRVTLYM